MRNMSVLSSCAIALVLAWVLRHREATEAAGPAGVSLDGHAVAEVMTAVILSLPPEADVTLAAERMRDAPALLAIRVHQLLALGSGRKRQDVPRERVVDRRGAAFGRRQAVARY